MGKDEAGFGRALPSEMPAHSHQLMLTSCPDVPIGASNLSTLILVEELLDALKRLQRAEIEAEQMEDESADRHDAGRLGEYQVCIRCSFPSGCTIHPAPAPPWVCEALSLTPARTWTNAELLFLLCRNWLPPSATPAMLGRNYVMRARTATRASFRVSKALLELKTPLWLMQCGHLPFR